MINIPRRELEKLSLLYTKNVQFALIEIFIDDLMAWW